MTTIGYLGVFQPGIDRIEVPIFQRDYAQGRDRRDDPRAAEIREGFLTAICESLKPDSPPLSLDFVYGKLENGALHPLDGQQRLTTLFLLHWYLAARSGNLDPEAAWTKFSYRTRPSADLFCRRLVENGTDLPAAAELGVRTVGAWIREQPWFLYEWRSDPTVSGMLNTLNGIAAECAKQHVDAQIAWDRLCADDPAISFHFRPIAEMGDERDLYIKMNSRGKPLTNFENFKARLGEVMAWAPLAEIDDLVHSFDGAWGELMWGLREPGDHEDALDHRLWNYVRFLTDVSRWRDGSQLEDPEFEQTQLAALTQGAFAAYGSAAPSSIRNLAFLIAGFDAWTKTDHRQYFADLFSQVPPLHLKGAVDLFAACCSGYDTSKFTLADSLLLVAVLVQLADPGPAAGEFSANLRTLRNLIQRTPIERDAMSRLIPAVWRLIQIGEIDDAFNSLQAREERVKRELLIANPETMTAVIHQLEDHYLLQGSLAAFDLTVEPEMLGARAAAFASAFTPQTDWLALSGALLSVGDYGWPRPHGRGNAARTLRQYGPGQDDPTAWRELLTNNDNHDRLANTRSVLGCYLDGLAQESDPNEHATSVIGKFLHEREAQGRYDWRYYFVKYPQMRTDTSGVYSLPDKNFGYSVLPNDAANLDRLEARKLRRGHTNIHSNNREPYLDAIVGRLGADAKSIVALPQRFWIDPRISPKKNNSLQVYNAAAGFVIVAPDPDHLRTLAAERVPDGQLGGAEIVAFRGERGFFMPIPRRESWPDCDAVNRIDVGVALVRELLAVTLRRAVNKPRESG